MSPSKLLPSRPSFESIRKQAKKLVRQFAAGDSDALTRVHAQLPAPILPLSLRDAQLVLAREYGFAGWQDLRAAVIRQEGISLDSAAAEAERAIHDNKVEQLAQLIQELSCASILVRRFRRIPARVCHWLVWRQRRSLPGADVHAPRMCRVSPGLWGHHEPGDMGRRNSRSRQRSVAASFAKRGSTA